MIRSHIQDLAENANLWQNAPCVPLVAVDFLSPNGRSKSSETVSCHAAVGLLEGPSKSSRTGPTTEFLAHRSRARRKKELTSPDCMCIYMYCEQAKFSYGLPS